MRIEKFYGFVYSVVVVSLIIVPLMGPMKASAAIARNAAAASSTTCNDGWHDGLPVDGVDGYVNAITVDSSGAVYAGGTFSVAGDVTANNIAKWDGSNWSALGSGVSGGVRELAISGTDLYVASTISSGGVTTASVSKWDGSSWSVLGSWFGESVLDIAVSGTEIYVAGGTWNGNFSSGFVAKWNGSGWSDLGPEMNSPVTSIALSGSTVYAAGNFTLSGNNQLNRIARWNGASWSQVGPGLSSEVNDIAVSATDLYAAGVVYQGPSSTGYVSRWNGGAWTPLGSGMTGQNGYASVGRLAVSGSDLYAAGGFSSAGGTSAKGIAKWNGSAWSALGSGVIGSSDIWANAGTVYSGGAGLSKWDGSTWARPGSAAVISRVDGLSTSGSDVYASGYFTVDSGTTWSMAAKWSGSSWTLIGSLPPDPFGTTRSVYSVTAGGTDLYVAGLYYDSNSQTRSGFVAKWNGTQWTYLGSGMNDTVEVVALSGVDVYAGGWFTTAGGVPANRIAKWNGSSWSALGAGMNWIVYDIALMGTDVYIGGAFYSTPESPASLVAKWNGSTWSALGSGPFTAPITNAPTEYYSGVTDLEVSGNFLWAAGGLGGDYGGGYGFVSKWNGSNWAELPRICCEPVQEIAVSGNDVYAGGWFTNAGGTAATHIAKWNGSSWSPLGTGLNGSADAIVVSGTDVFVGGSFSTAGCHISAYSARFTDPTTHASVSGSVTTPNGLGLRNATVVLIDQAGVERRVTTSSFGLFTFDSVPIGPSYTLTARSKRYRFAPRQIQVNGPVTGIGLVGQE